jgi:hypothetical protein
MSCHELVYWSFCASLWSHGAPVYFVRVRSNSCSSMMLGRVACWRAVRAGFVVSCRVLSTAGRRGGQRQPRRPCRALSMDRIHQVMTFCETATWAHRASVAHLVSLYSSYAHRTPREGVRSPSGCSGLEVFPTVRTNPLRAKSLFAAASPKSDLWIIVNILLKTRLFRLINNSSSSLWVALSSQRASSLC